MERIRSANQVGRGAFPQRSWRAAPRRLLSRRHFKVVDSGETVPTVTQPSKAAVPQWRTNSNARTCGVGHESMAMGSRLFYRN